MHAMCESCMEDVMCLDGTLEMCAILSVVQSFVSFHLLSLCPPLPTDNTYTLHCVSTCSPVVQFLRVASRCSSTLLTPKVPQPQPTDRRSCRGEGQGRGSPHRHREHNRTTRQHHVQVRPAMEMCVVQCPCTANHAMHLALHTLCGPTLY